MSFSDFLKPEPTAAELKDIQEEKKIVEAFEQDKLTFAQCFEDYINPTVMTLRSSLNNTDPQKRYRQKLRGDQLNEAIKTLKTKLAEMQSSEDENVRAAAKTILIQHTTMFFRLSEQHKRFQSLAKQGQAEPSPGFYQSARNDSRAKAFDLIEKQKICFKALSDAYGKKINKPQFVFTLCRVMLMIGVILSTTFAFGATIPFTAIGLSVGATNIPVVGVGFAAANTFFSQAFSFLGASATISKTMCTMLASIGLFRIAPAIFNKNMDDYIGSSPETAIRPKGLYEIDNKGGEKLAKNINQIIELANTIVDNGEQNILQEQQQAPNGQNEYDEYDEYDYENPLHPLNPSIQ